MAEASENAEAGAAPAKKKGGKKKLLILLLAPLLLLGGGGGAAYKFVPAVHDKIAGLLGHKPAEGEKTAEGGEKGEKPEKAEKKEAAEEHPFFVEIPEMTVTLPNSGRARQLRIKIALELAKRPVEGKEDPKAEILTPRVYDGLVLYLRTLRDAEVDGALSVDRMRGDLQRRLDLMLGDGVLRDVLITSLIIG